jgi:hypothetical protein
VAGKEEWHRALRELVDYEAGHGKMLTLLKYHPAAHSLLVPLNYDIPSIFGPVDVDWMFRVAWASGSEFAGWMMYRTAKFYWNITDPRKTGWESRMDMRSIFQTANENAPRVAHQWLSTDLTLKQIFAPAL